MPSPKDTRDLVPEGVERSRTKNRLALVERQREEARLRVGTLRDQLDEAADRATTLEELASLLERDESIEVRENVRRELNEIADTLAKLPQRAINEYDEIQAVHDRAERLAHRLKEVERQRDEEKQRTAIWRKDCEAAEEDRDEAEERAETAEAALAQRDQQVREQLEAAIGLLPCDCPGRGLTDPKQHADECAISIGGRVIELGLTQPSSNPPQLDREDGEDASGPRWKGTRFIVALPPDTPEGRQHVAKIIGDLAQLPTGWEAVEFAPIGELRELRLRCAHYRNEWVNARSDAFAEAVEELLDPIRDRLVASLNAAALTQPEADPEVPGITGHEIEEIGHALVADREVPRCGGSGKVYEGGSGNPYDEDPLVERDCPGCPDCQSTPELLGEAIALFERKVREAEEQGGNPVAESYLHEVVLPELRSLQATGGSSECDRLAEFIGGAADHLEAEGHMAAAEYLRTELSRCTFTQPVSESPGDSGEGLKEAFAVFDARTRAEAEARTPKDLPAIFTQPVPGNSGGVEEDCDFGLEQIPAILEEALGGPQFKHDVRVVYVRMLARTMVEFDAWLSFRPEYAEVLTAYRSAFGINTSAAASTQPPSPQAEVQDCEGSR